MSDDAPPSGSPPQAVVYLFDVHCGMSLVLRIETPHWYAGLLHAALARIALEGQN